MAKRPGKLTVKITPKAWLDLDSVWKWNLDRYGMEHADRYLSFLMAEAQCLESDHGQGKPVPSRPGVQSYLLKRSKRGHGHLAIYRVVGGCVEILRFFHTAQDWHRQLKRKS